MPSAAGTATDHVTRPASGPSRIWPRTAALVLLGWVLLAWDVVAAGINAAAFFGDIPSRDRYAESGAALLTALVPVALLCTIGLLSRCRYGLLLLAAPAAVVAALGADLAGRAGDPADPDPHRPFAATDLVADLTRLNWVATGALVVVLAAQVAWAVRQSGRRPDPQA
ncbi:hypothetical protein ACFUC1_16030 [Pedococcus sp. NPDC057267]|uniref:hypothetical protein n=1 Tax=Pedococcus sp. NPDC057267 TaxID=3346077 RepID=UPI00362559C8